MTDPFHSERLDSAAGLAAAEEAVDRAARSAFRTWLKAVIAQVMSGVRPDPDAVFAASGVWATQVDRILEVLGPVIARSFGLLGEGYNWRADPGVKNYMAEARNRLVRVPDEVYQMITEQLQEGAQLGESMGQLRERVQEALSTSKTDTWANRAATIARTETIGAFNSSRDASFKAFAGEVNEPLQKLWLATIDDRTRESHRLADGQRVPVGQAFEVGGSRVMYPGDPSGPADEVINCRCTMLLVKPGETLDLSNRQSRG